MGNALKKHIDHAEKTGVCQLSAMDISEFPEQLLKLSKKLRTLDLSNNKLQSLPEAIGTFVVLKSLNLNNNKFSTFCSGMNQLRKLETLTAANNKLTKMPPNIHQWVALKTLVLKNNKLKEIPDEMTKLKNLDSLDLSGNCITVVPDSIQNLPVVELNLNQNQISILPDALSQCSRLKVLRFEENCVSLDGISTKILEDSNISLLAFNGNLFSQKDFQSVDGYDKYMERYTATKKKFD